MMRKEAQKSIAGWVKQARKKSRRRTPIERRSARLLLARWRQWLQRIRSSVFQIEAARSIHADLDGTALFCGIRIAGVVTQNIVIAGFRIDPLQRLVEIVRVDDRDTAGLLRQHAQAVLRFANVILPLDLIDVFVQIRTADETARINRVERGVGAVRFPRELGELRREIGERELVRLLVRRERVGVARSAVVTIAARKAAARGP